MADFTLEIVGTAPLLMHNARLSNPMDPIAKRMKEISSRRRKTDEDHAQMADLEFQGGLYHDEDLGPFIPGANIWRSIYDAAKKFKMGPTIKSGVIVTSNEAPLIYTGPRDLVGLVEDKNFRATHSVKVQTSRVMRTRPLFKQWALTASGIYDDSLIDFTDLKRIVETAGKQIGLGDWRPQYGRFGVEVSE